MALPKRVTPPQPYRLVAAPLGSSMKAFVTVSHFLRAINLADGCLVCDARHQKPPVPKPPQSQTNPTSPAMTASGQLEQRPEVSGLRSAKSGAHHLKRAGRVGSFTPNSFAASETCRACVSSRGSSIRPSIRSAGRATRPGRSRVSSRQDRAGKPAPRRCGTPRN